MFSKLYTNIPTNMLTSCRGLRQIIPIARGATLKHRINKENKEMFGELAEKKSVRLLRLEDVKDPIVMPVNVSSPPIRVLVKRKITPKYATNVSDILQQKLNAPPAVIQGHIKKLGCVDKMKQNVININPSEGVGSISADKTSIRQSHVKKLSSANKRNIANKNSSEGISEKLSGETEVKSVKTPDDVLMKEIYHTVISSMPTSSLLLPDTVIKNLTSFPMIWNGQIKQEETDIVNMANKDTNRLFPSVSKILNNTMSASAKAALQRWRSKLIEQLGEDGFLRYSQGLLTQGAKFHELIQAHLMGETPEVTPELEGCWTSLQAEVLPRIGSVVATEKHVFHPWLLYRGVIDCLAHFDGMPMLIEWKKADRRKSDLKYTFDAPVQLTAYMGALSFDHSCNFKLHGGVVVVAYTDGSPAEAFPLTLSECSPHWAAWLARLQLYWQHQQKGEIPTT